ALDDSRAAASNLQKMVDSNAASLGQARTDLASAKKQLAQAEKVAADAKADGDSRALLLQKELAQRVADAAALSAKVAAQEAALSATGDSGAKAQALSGELASTRKALDDSKTAAADLRREADGNAAS